MHHESTFDSSAGYGNDEGRRRRRVVVFVTRNKNMSVEFSCVSTKDWPCKESNSASLYATSIPIMRIPKIYVEIKLSDLFPVSVQATLT